MTNRQNLGKVCCWAHLSHTYHKTRLSGSQLPQTVFSPETVWGSISPTLSNIRAHLPWITIYTSAAYMSWSTINISQICQLHFFTKWALTSHTSTPHIWIKFDICIVDFSVYVLLFGYTFLGQDLTLMSQRHTSALGMSEVLISPELIF